MNVVPTTAAGTAGVDPVPPAELVVQSGRMKGARRALTGPTTLIGHGYTCEVRLNVDSIQGLHCIIVHSVDGYVIRDMAGDGSTTVNGERVVGTQQLLKDRDLIGIGPFQFRIEIPRAAQPENLKQLAATIQSERDALRIQAAAVAAQQAGLTEEEIRLEQRRTALQHQEEQLAAHLLDRQRELRELELRVQQEKAILESAQQGQDESLVQTRGELEQARAEKEELAQELRGQQRRLKKLRQRFKRHWQAKWNQHRQELDLKAQSLSDREARLQKEAEKLEQERCQLAEFRLHSNSEMEQGRRLLQEEWQQLAAAQKQWETTSRTAREDLAVRQKAVEEREHGAELTLLGSQGTSLPVSWTFGLPVSWSTLAELVADQRWHLVEQWQRVLQAQCAWEREHEAALTELEEGSRQLEQREHGIEERARQLQSQEQTLQVRLSQLQERQEALSQLRGSLEGWQARLKLQSVTWHGEREQLLSQVRAREEAVAEQLARVRQLHQKQTQGLKQLAATLGKARQRCDKERRQYVALWKACQQNQALPGEKRLEREREALLHEMTRLDERAQWLDQMEKELVTRTEALAGQVADLQKQQAELGEGDARRTQEIQKAQAQQRLAEQQAQELREEVERLAQMLLEETDASGPRRGLAA